MVAYCPKCRTTVVFSDDPDYPFHCETCGKNYSALRCPTAHIYEVHVSDKGVWKKVFVGYVEDATNEAKHLLLNGYTVKLEIVYDEWEVEAEAEANRHVGQQ